jgi:hypothetical protein
MTRGYNQQLIDELAVMSYEAVAAALDKEFPEENIHSLLYVKQIEHRAFRKIKKALQAKIGQRKIIALFRELARYREQDKIAIPALTGPGLMKHVLLKRFYTKDQQMPSGIDIDD